MNIPHKTVEDLEKQLASAKKHIKVLQAENIEQWDEIVALRNDAKDHELIVKIYADKVIRLKGVDHEVSKL